MALERKEEKIFIYIYTYIIREERQNGQIKASRGLAGSFQSCRANKQRLQTEGTRGHSRAQKEGPRMLSSQIRVVRLEGTGTGKKRDLLVQSSSRQPRRERTKRAVLHVLVEHAFRMHSKIRGIRYGPASVA